MSSPSHPLSVAMASTPSYETAWPLPLAAGPAVGRLSVRAAQFSGLLCFCRPGRGHVAGHQLFGLGADRLQGLCRACRTTRRLLRDPIFWQAVYEHDFLHRHDRALAADSGADHGAGAQPGHPRPHRLPAHLLYAGGDHDRGRRHRLSPAADHQRPGQPAAWRDCTPVWSSHSLPPTGWAARSIPSGRS